MNLDGLFQKEGNGREDREIEKGEMKPKEAYAAV